MCVVPTEQTHCTNINSFNLFVSVIRLHHRTFGWPLLMWGYGKEGLRRHLEALQGREKSLLDIRPGIREQSTT